MKAPTYQAPPPDPQIEALKARSEADDIRALQDTAAIDSASLMARYGTRLALAGSSPGSPLAVTPPPVRVRAA